MAAMSRKELSQALLESFEDIAMVMGNTMTTQQHLREIWSRNARIWEMAGLGDVPEFEMEVRPKVLREAAA